LRPDPRGHTPRGGDPVRQLLDGLAELLTGLVYVAPERARAFTHETSSFIWSTDSVGAGGTPRRSSFTPTRSRMPARTATTTVTISAASHVETTLDRAMMAVAASAPSATSPRTAAAPTAAPPKARRLAFSS